jgi:hypothetical protein
VWFDTLTGRALINLFSASLLLFIYTTDHAKQNSLSIQAIHKIPSIFGPSDNQIYKYQT